MARFKAVLVCLAPGGKTLSHTERHPPAAINARDVKAMQATLASADRAFAEAATCVRNLPAGNPDLEGANRKSESAIQLQADAFRLHHEGIDELAEGGKSIKFDAGVPREEEGTRIIKSVAEQLEAVYRRLGAPAELGSSLPLDDLKRLKEQQ